MKITVKVDNVEITISEEDNSEERGATLRYSDQNKQIQETLVVMAAQAVKLRAASK